jgi:phosphoglycerol transferase MdoB-like AlkP superfamily enzyme
MADQVPTGGWLSRWLVLLRRLGLVLGAYFLLRVLFLFCNHSLLAGASFAQLARAFLHGFRFDLSAVAASNAPFILLTLLPWRQPGPAYERLTKIVFVALNGLFLAINVIDLEFFKFTGRRFTFDLLRMGNDAGVKWNTLLSYYWPLVLLGLGLIAALYFCYGRPAAGSAAEAPRHRFGSWGCNLVLGVALIVVAVRGGFQFIPIGPPTAMVLNDRGLAQLALNSSFTLIKSWNNTTQLARHRYFSGWKELKDYLRPLVNGSPLVAEPAPRDNVVILIVESLSAEYCGAGPGGPRYTPFLDTLAAQSLFFRNNYANGRRSVESMPSILAGLPSLMQESFVESVYCDNHLLGLGTWLAPRGYTTSFFHGGQNGTMRFDLFMPSVGIQRYYGRNEYPGQGDYDGSWGIFDEPFLQFTARELSRQPQPFAAVVFTLSSHHPYRIPEKYRGRFKKGTLAIHESIGYADYALEQFFATARQQPWYSNTLFVITADHTQKLETPEFVNPLGAYRVPLLFFHPRKPFPTVDAGRITQQVDILPSVLDYLGLPADQRLLFGKSVFRQGEGRAFLHANGQYWLVRGQRALEFTPGRPSRLFDPAGDPLLKSPIPNEPEQLRAMEREAEALVQYFNNGLLDHQLYDRVEGGTAGAGGQRRDRVEAGAKDVHTQKAPE